MLKKWYRMAAKWLQMQFMPNLRLEDEKSGRRPSIEPTVDVEDTHILALRENPHANQCYGRKRD